MTKLEFNKKFSTHREKLYGFALKLTRSTNDANDLMQETAFRAFKNRDRFRAGTNFKAWVSTIMRNTFINNYRKKKTRNRTEKPIEDNWEALKKKAVSNKAESNLSVREIQNTIDQLDDPFRQPFMMFFEGYQYKEIAEKMDLKIGTVKSRIFFARKKIKQKMAQMEF
jgi:RNA polymerase sigma-70 factor (ECF subfamily)